MSSRMFKSIWILSFIFLISGCDGQDGSELVNRQYLQTEEYSEFEQSSKKELSKNKHTNRSFPSHIAQLTNCEQVEELTIPFRLNQEALTILQKEAGDSCVVESREKPAYSVLLVGKSNYETIDLYWVLLDRPSVYKNQGLFIATFQNDSLLNYNAVGSFEKDLSKKVTTDIHVRQAQKNLEIISKTDRNIIYPFKQENTIEESFIINPDGEIRIKK